MTASAETAERAISAARTPARKIEIAKTAFEQGIISRARLIAVLAQAKAATPGRDKPWAPWEEQILVIGRSRGDNFDLIAAKLPDRTRSACIGRAGRMGLCCVDKRRAVLKAYARHRAPETV